MRSALLAIPLLAAPLHAGTTHRPAPPTCGAAALAAAPDSWDEARVIAGDLTGDGTEDVVFWRNEDGAVMVYLAACEGETAVETWRFRVPLEGACATAAVPVTIESPLLDAALMQRVCGAGETDECLNMRRDNERRQGLANAGARDLRVGDPDCGGVRFRWTAEQHGFLRIGN